MLPASKYYARKRDGRWQVTTYHPRKEARPPEARKPIVVSYHLENALGKLHRRILSYRTN